jgi:hypothetical protein
MKRPKIRRLFLFRFIEAMFGPKAQPFPQPWASPRETGRHDLHIGPTGQPFLEANDWPVGPNLISPALDPLGDAQGWENRCPFGAA